MDYWHGKLTPIEELFKAEADEKSTSGEEHKLCCDILLEISCREWRLQVTWTKG